MPSYEPYGSPVGVPRMPPARYGAASAGSSLTPWQMSQATRHQQNFSDFMPQASQAVAGNLVAHSLAPGRQAGIDRPVAQKLAATRQSLGQANRMAMAPPPPMQPYDPHSRPQMMAGGMGAAPGPSPLALAAQRAVAPGGMPPPSASGGAMLPDPAKAPPIRPGGAGVAPPQILQLAGGGPAAPVVPAFGGRPQTPVVPPFGGNRNPFADPQVPLAGGLPPLPPQVPQFGDNRAVPPPPAAGLGQALVRRGMFGHGGGQDVGGVDMAMGVPGGMAGLMEGRMNPRAQLHQQMLHLAGGDPIKAAAMMSIHGNMAMGGVHRFLQQNEDRDRTYQMQQGEQARLDRALGLEGERLAQNKVFEEAKLAQQAKEHGLNERLAEPRIEEIRNRPRNDLIGFYAQQGNPDPVGAANKAMAAGNPQSGALQPLQQAMIKGGIADAGGDPSRFHQLISGSGQAGAGDPNSPFGMEARGQFMAQPGALEQSQPAVGSAYLGRNLENFREMSPLSKGLFRAMGGLGLTGTGGGWGRDWFQSPAERMDQQNAAGAYLRGQPAPPPYQPPPRTPGFGDAVAMMPNPLTMMLRTLGIGG